MEAEVVVLACFLGEKKKYPVVRKLLLSQI